jgi:hypothetical protein
MSLTPQAKQLLAIRGDLLTFAPICLRIADKQGKLVPLELNRAQRYAHRRIESQRRRTGRVRMFFLKGRQQGISTYVSARFYWRASGTFGVRMVIMTHLKEATKNLFDMVKRYHDNVPSAIRPSTKADNANELHFEYLHTKYTVTTAGSRNTGRSATAQFFHGSEVAFWENAEKHMAGIGQIVPMADDTEILLESTANGIGNRFHKGVMDALKGKGDYELCFIPWFWQEEYRRAVPEGYAFEVADLDYQRDYGIDDEQLYWRRLKIDDDFSGDDSLFDQEYPASVALAFTAGTSKALIKPGPVARALRNHALPDNSTDALILGVDPAEYGDDDTAFVLRRGPKVLAAWTYSKEGNAEIAGRVALLIEKFKERDDPIDAVVIDVTGVGTGVEAFLSDAGYQNIYRMHNGAVAIEDEKYINRAAEGWSLMKEWFEDAHRHASLPDPDTLKKKGKKVQAAAIETLQAELSSREYDYDSRRRVRLESKEHMLKRGIPSPNVADALALTFNVRVAAKPRKKGGETLSQKLARLRASRLRRGTPGMTR